jgi:hypothetical protein
MKPILALALFLAPLAGQVSAQEAGCSESKAVAQTECSQSAAKAVAQAGNCEATAQSAGTCSTARPAAQRGHCDKMSAQAKVAQVAVAVPVEKAACDSGKEASCEVATVAVQAPAAQDCCSEGKGKAAKAVAAKAASACEESAACDAPKSDCGEEKASCEVATIAVQAPATGGDCCASGKGKKAAAVKLQSCETESSCSSAAPAAAVAECEVVVECEVESSCEEIEEIAMIAPIEIQACGDGGEAACSAGDDLAVFKVHAGEEGDFLAFEDLAAVELDGIQIQVAGEALEMPLQWVAADNGECGDCQGGGKKAAKKSKKGGKKVQTQVVELGDGGHYEVIVMTEGEDCDGGSCAPQAKQKKVDVRVEKKKAAAMKAKKAAAKKGAKARMAPPAPMGMGGCDCCGECPMGQAMPQRKMMGMGGHPGMGGMRPMQGPRGPMGMMKMRRMGGMHGGMEMPHPMPHGEHAMPLHGEHEIRILGGVEGHEMPLMLHGLGGGGARVEVRGMMIDDGGRVIRFGEWGEDCEESCEEACEDDDDCGDCEESCEDDDDCGDCEESCEDDDDCGDCEESCEDDDDCGDCEESCEDDDDCGDCDDACEEVCEEEAKPTKRRAEPAAFGVEVDRMGRIEQRIAEFEVQLARIESLLDAIANG